MESPIKPIFLLADSQLLFWHIGGRLFLERVRAALRDETPAQPIKATYPGASNRDAPEYYELFIAAMDGIRIRDCRMIPSLPSDDDHAYLWRGYARHRYTQRQRRHFPPRWRDRADSTSTGRAHAPQRYDRAGAALAASGRWLIDQGAYH